MLAGPAGCLRSRWRSSLWKWRNDAAPRGRGQKAPSTTRCIKTLKFMVMPLCVSRQKAPSTTRCIKTPGLFNDRTVFLESESTQYHKVH